MAYLLNTPAQRQEMLRAIGVETVNDLFKQIPAELQLDRPLDLPEPLTEMDLESYMRRMAAMNVGQSSRVCLLGGGAYDHYIPAVVDEIAGRGEYYTAYTPYQAEASQGSLQTFFEYQTLICQLTGMDVSNASLYEGGTAVSEAAFMAMRVTRRHDKVVILGSVHPEYRQVVQTYLSQLNCRVEIVPAPQGTVELSEVAAALDEDTACLIVQHPNFFGCLEDTKALMDLAHQHGALGIVSFDPISLGLLQRPGDYGADIAVAEGQPLGVPLQFGGPFLGIMACRQKFVRQMPGRLIGQTVDRNGKRCFVLNLQAREQHIRREKATSNICTNQGLLAIRATIYLSLLGKQGLREVAELCCRKAHYAAEQLQSVDGLELAFDRPYFKEFAVRSRHGVDKVLQAARQAGFDAGPALRDVADGDPLLQPFADDTFLVAVTEQRTRAEIDGLVSALRTGLTA